MTNQNSSLVTEAEKDLLTYQVAEAAKSQIVSWAKWIIGTLTIVVAILGVKTYIDVQSKIDKTISDELLQAKQKTTQAITQFETEKNEALAKLDETINSANKAVALKAERAQSRIDLIVATLPSSFPGSGKVLIRSIYNASNKSGLPGDIARSEGQGPTGDKVVDRVYDHIGIINQFLSTVFNYDLTNAIGNEAIATVHYREKYNNAYWNGNQIVLGDGDGEVFKDFSSIDIVSAEIANGIVGNKLVYEGESGAIHQHFRDVLATMILQWHKKQTVNEASWLIGEEILGNKVNGVALRSLKKPGTAYDDGLLGKDQQPHHMNKYVVTEGDNGGVHINSGIPNHAFYLAATSIGGYSWERIGKVWFESHEKFKPRMTFNEFAKLLVQISKKLYGEDSNEANVIAASWKQVGVTLVNSPNQTN